MFLGYLAFSLFKHLWLLIWLTHTIWLLTLAKQHLKGNCLAHTLTLIVIFRLWRCAHEKLGQALCEKLYYSSFFLLSSLFLVCSLLLVTLSIYDLYKLLLLHGRLIALQHFKHLLLYSIIRFYDLTMRKKWGLLRNFRAASGRFDGVELAKRLLL